MAGILVSFTVLQITISGLLPGTEYEVQVAGATKSIFSQEMYFIGAYSDAHTVLVKGMYTIDVSPMPAMKKGFSHILSLTSSLKS